MAKKFWSLLGLFAAFLAVLTNLQIIVPVAVISCTAAVVWHLIHTAFEREERQNENSWACDYRPAGFQKQSEMQNTVSLPKIISPEEQNILNFEALETQLTNNLRQRDPFCDWQWRDNALSDYQKGSRFLMFHAMIQGIPYEGCLHLSTHGLWNMVELRKKESKNLRKEGTAPHENKTENIKEAECKNPATRKDVPDDSKEGTQQSYKPRVQIVGEKDANEAYYASLQNSADQWLEKHRDEIIILESRFAQEGGYYTYDKEELPENRDTWDLIEERINTLGLVAKIDEDCLQIQRREIQEAS